MRKSELKEFIRLSLKEIREESKKSEINPVVKKEVKEVKEVKAGSLRHLTCVVCPQVIGLFR